MKRLLRYLRARRFDRDLKAEIEAHVEEKIDDYVENGIPRDEARTLSLRQFGNRTRAAETSREQWAFRPLDELGQDLRYALRVLARNRWFTLVSVLSLAMCIGTNTIVFGVVEQVLLRSLPYSAPRSPVHRVGSVSPSRN